MNSNFSLEENNKKKLILNDLLNKILNKRLKILENKNEEEQNNLKYIKNNIDNTLKTVNFMNNNLISRQIYFTQRNSRDNFNFRSHLNNFYKTKNNNNNNRIISYTPINVHNKNKFEIKKKSNINNINKINNICHKRNLTPIPTKRIFKKSNLTSHVSFKSKVTKENVNQNYSFIITKNYNKKNSNILKTPERKRKSHIINHDYNSKTSNTKKNNKIIINNNYSANNNINNSANNNINNSANNNINYSADNNSANNNINYSVSNNSANNNINNNINVNDKNNNINVNNNNVNNNNKNNDNNNNNKNNNKNNNNNISNLLLKAEEKISIKTSNLFDLDNMDLNNDILLTNIDDESLDLISFTPKESIYNNINFDNNNNNINNFNIDEKKSNFDFLKILNEQNISSTFLSFLSNSELKNLLFINKKLGKIISNYLIDDFNTIILKKANYLNTEMKEIFERRQKINYNEIINKNPFHLSNNAFRALNLLNEEQYLSIFKNYLDKNNEKIYENEDVIKIFKLLFLILKKNPERKKIIEEFDNNNDNNNLIWMNISNYILNEIKNCNFLLGDYLKEEFNQIDLNIENLLKIEEFVTPIFYIFNHLNFIKISSAVSFIVVALKDVIKYLEFPINQIEKLNSINVELKNLKKITMKLENIKNNFFD